MSNVIPLGSTCEYLLSRASAHRRAGRYDEAMALLTRAKEMHGSTEEIEYETAQVYEEMDCEEEAARAYLRVVRCCGSFAPRALFQLALSSAQHADLPRAWSYFERFSATDRSGVQAEYADLLSSQLRAQAERAAPANRKERAGQLEQRASSRLQEGKAPAAYRTMKHALRLHENAQGYTMLACCCLMMGRAEEAIAHAKKGCRKARGSVQAMCILSDAYAFAGEKKMAERAAALAALRAEDTEDLFSAAIEAAKQGMDDLVLRLTQRIMRREPFHTKAMMISAAALVRMKRDKDANRLYGRLCGLLPENTVCDAYFRMTRGDLPQETPPPLGLDVGPVEADRRIAMLIEAMYEEESDICADNERLRVLCRVSAWALRSQYSGQYGALIAVMLMNALDDVRAQEVLLDALMDPQITKSLKMAILQTMTGSRGIQPYFADMDGRLVRLAAGANAQGTGVRAGQGVVQAAADHLMARFPDAPSVMLSMWVAYLDIFGAPARKNMNVCAAALEMLYHEKAGHKADPARIAGRCGVSVRACRYYAGKIRRAAQLREHRSKESALYDENDL